MIIEDTADAEPKLFSLSRNDITTFKLNDTNLEEDATEVLSLDEETLNTSDPSEQSVEKKKETEESYIDEDTSAERKISGRVLEYAFQAEQYDFGKDDEVDEPKTFQDHGSHIQEETDLVEEVSVDNDDMKEPGDAIANNIDTAHSADTAVQVGEVAESTEDNMMPFEKTTSELLAHDHPIDDMSENNNEDYAQRYKFATISDDINWKKDAEITEDNTTPEEAPTTIADCTPFVVDDDSMHATARAAGDDDYLNEVTENVDGAEMTFEELTSNAADNTAELAKRTEVDIAFLDEFAADAAAPEEYDGAADFIESAKKDTNLKEDIIMTTAATDQNIHATEQAANDSSLEDVTEMIQDTMLPTEELTAAVDNTPDVIESLEEMVAPDDIHPIEHAANDSSLEDVTEMIRDTMLPTEELTAAADNMADVIDPPEEQFSDPAFHIESNSNNTAELFEGVKEDTAALKELTIATAATIADDDIYAMAAAINDPFINNEPENLEEVSFVEEEFTAIAEMANDKNTADLTESITENIASLEKLATITAAEHVAAGLLEINDTDSRQSNEVFAADSENFLTENQKDEINENTDVDDITSIESGVAYAKSTETADAIIFDEVPLTNYNKSEENQDTDQFFDFDVLSFDETVPMQPSSGITDREAVFDNDVFDQLLPSANIPISILDDMHPEPLENTTQQISNILNDVTDADPLALDEKINQLTTVEEDQLPSENGLVTDKDFSTFNSALFSFESTSVHDEVNKFGPEADTASIDDDFDYNESTFINDYDEVPEEADSTLIQEDFNELNEFSQEKLSKIDDVDDNRNDAAVVDQSLSYDSIMDVRSEAHDDSLNTNDDIKNDVDVESPKESMDVDLVDMNSNHDDYINWSIEEDEATVKAGDPDVDHDDTATLPIQQRPWTSSSILESSTSPYDAPNSLLSLTAERRLDLQTRREKSTSAIMRIGKALDESNQKITPNQAEQLFLRLMEHRKRIDEKLKALRKEREDEELKYVRENYGRTLSAKEAEQLFDRLYRVDTISRSYAKGTLLPYESMNRE